MPFWTQTGVLLHKFNLAYWRSPGYNLIRVGMTFVARWVGGRLVPRLALTIVVRASDERAPRLAMCAISSCHTYFFGTALNFACTQSCLNFLLVLSPSPPFAPPPRSLVYLAIYWGEGHFPSPATIANVQNGA